MADQKLTDRSEITTVNDVDLLHVVQGGVSYKVIKENLIGDKLKEDAAVTGAYDIDWNFSTQLLTLTGDSTWSDINLPSVGITKVITLYVTGDFALTIPTDWTTNLTGDYDGTVLNQIVVEYVKSGVYWVTINQA